MTMIASLKALLFAAPAGPGKAKPVALADGTPDFAQWMNVTTVQPPMPMPGVAPLPLPVEVTDADVTIPADGEAPLPVAHPRFTALDAVPIDSASSGQARFTPASVPAATPPIQPTQNMLPDCAEPVQVAAPVDGPSPPSDLPASAERADIVPPAAPMPIATQDQPLPSIARQAPSPVVLSPVTAPPVAPVISSDQTLVTEEDAGSADVETEHPKQQAAPVPPLAPVIASVPSVTVPPLSPPEQTMTDAQANRLSPVESQAIPVSVTTQPPPALARPDAMAEPTMLPLAPPATVPLPLPLAASVIPSPPVAMTAPDDAVPEETAPVAIAHPADPGPTKAVALSLLQLARRHMLRRPAGAESGPPPLSAASPAVRDRAPLPLDMPPVSAGSIGVPIPVQTAVAAPSAPFLPTVDLSASLGAQVVDMGVSGQWIDGLARDIAGLSANGAQGRFQISTDHLGPIEVNIRQGVDGAAVSLTVANDAAEAALRQDSDRLRLDAGLSALRISEVKIERAPQGSDTGRSDASQQQQSVQQNPTSQGQSGGWQGAGQPQQQGRSPSRENIALAHKAGGDPAVLNHEQAGDSASEVIRTRYA